MKQKQMFFWNSCFFDDPEDVGHLISGFSAFSKTSLNIWKFTVHILLKPGLENFKHYFTSVWDECNCAIVWAFFGIAFLWDWNENWPFLVLWPLLSFPNLLAYWVNQDCFYSLWVPLQIDFPCWHVMRSRAIFEVGSLANVATIPGLYPQLLALCFFSASSSEGQWSVAQSWTPPDWQQAALLVTDNKAQNN